MSSETKRDVLLYFGDYVLRNFNTPNIIFGGEQVAEYMQRYDAALPDDLPVIPKAVGEWLKNCKHDECDLVDAIVSSVNSIITSRRVTRWMEDHFDTFARAWVLGVWRIEETGEIVKVKAEK